MTVLLFHKRFGPLIKAGTKTQTIRPKRKRPIQVGEALSLREWEGVAYRSRMVELLKTVCIGVFAVRVGQSRVEIGRGGIFAAVSLDDFARSDAFRDWLDMRQWYLSAAGYGLPFEGELIQWTPPPPTCELCGRQFTESGELKGLCAVCSDNLGGNVYSARIVRQEASGRRKERD